MSAIINTSLTYLFNTINENTKYISEERNRIISNTNNNINNINTNSNSNKTFFIKAVDYTFNIFTSFVRFIGPFFFIALSLFIFLVASVFFRSILPFYNSMFYLKVFLIKVALYLLIQIYFNYIMCCIVKPGSANEIVNSKRYANKSPFEFNEIDFYSVFKNKRSNKITKNNINYTKALKYIDSNSNIELIQSNNKVDNNNNEVNKSNNTYNMLDNETKSCSSENKEDLEMNDLNEDTLFSEEDNYFKIKKIKNKEYLDDKNTNNITNNHKNNNNNNNKFSNISENCSNEIYSSLKYCNICSQYKPIRSHHCNICGYCVLKMDHHCPWINNCVGQNNLRYFILFLTWIYIGCLFIIFTSLPSFFMSDEKFSHFTNNKRKVEFKFVIVLCIAGSVMLTFFNVWNWFLILKGSTTIEFWTRSPIPSKNKFTVINDFSLGIKDNFYVTFGTHNPFKVLFIPSIKSLSYSGLEWSKIINNNVDKLIVINKINYIELKSEGD